jgi:hypothetical protein
MKIMIKHVLSTIGLVCFLFLAVGSTEDSSASKTSSSRSNSSLKELYPDVCRCLVEPGNTQWAKDNIDTCRDAISKKIGVANWETINFSQNPMLDARWENLKLSCGY